MRKKLNALSKEKECELAAEWKKSLMNHLYWSAVSTPDGKGDFLIQAKWISLDNHIHNKHKRHGKLFPRCQHRCLRRGRKKKWFKPRECMPTYQQLDIIKIMYFSYCTDTKASERISSIIQNKSFCADVKKLSPVFQTSTCEAFHSVVINFAPKSTAFTYNGMRAR